MMIMMPIAVLASCSSIQALGGLSLTFGKSHWSHFGLNLHFVHRACITSLTILSEYFPKQHKPVDTYNLDTCISCKAGTSYLNIAQNKFETHRLPDRRA
jgi:hypothetical protein